MTTRAPIGQHVKRFRQIKAPPGHVKERVYPKQVNQESDVQRYGELKAIKKNETIFAAYDKAEMRKASIMIVANSDFIHTSKSLFWHYNVGSGRPGSNAVGVNGNRGTTTHGNEPNHNLICQPTTAEDTVWPAIKDIIESMGEVVDTLKESAFRKITPRAVFELSPGYAHLSDGLKFVYAMVALLSEGKYDVIISAANCGIEMENLRPLKAELPALWSDISNAIRGLRNHALHIIVLDEILVLELSSFSRQLKLKPGIDDDHRKIVAMSNDLWFRGMKVKEERERRKNSKETRAHLEAMVLRTKPDANKWFHLTPRIAALGADASERGPVMIRRIHAYLIKEFLQAFVEVTIVE